jgi:hypothetical protein
MKLTNYIPNAGSVVAYYPKLRKITDSTNATLLLCQLLYWSNKVDDGKIFKDSYDIENETGLTYWEQKTAREKLREAGLIDEKYSRINHKICFTINQDNLSEAWKKSTGGEIKEIIKNEPVKKNTKPSVNKIKEQLKTAEKEISEKPKDKKDAADWLAKAIGIDSPTQIKYNKKQEIRTQIEEKLHIVANDSRWEKFIDFVYERETKHNQPVSIFLNWAISEGFDPLYWTPEKCKTVYPRAFSENERNLPSKDFVKNLPEYKEKEYVPMPDSLKTKRDLGFD